jgi:hypothetical protein
VPHTPLDQQTAHENVPDEAHVGRFSIGIEAAPRDRATLHRGRFSEGLERLPETSRKRHLGRCSAGLEALPETPPKLRSGSFADRDPDRPTAP